MNQFLNIFGLKQESEALLAKAQAAGRRSRLSVWYLAQSARGEQLLTEGRVAEAEKVFRTCWTGSAPSPVTTSRYLGPPGAVFQRGGRPDMAEQCCQDAISVLDQLEQTDG